MRPLIFDPHRVFAWTSAAEAALRTALRWTSHHTGLPVTLVAAIGLVASYRLFRRAARVAFEVALAFALLLVATRLGWIRW